MSEIAAIDQPRIEAHAGAPALRRMAELSPQIAGFNPVSRKRYDPAENAIHSPWPTMPWASEDWKVLPPELQVTECAPVLIFEHFALPRTLPRMAAALTTHQGSGQEEDQEQGRGLRFLLNWAKTTDPMADKAFQRAFVEFTRARSFANHILRSRTGMRFSIGCRRLLEHVPEIPRDGVQAGVLRAQYLGGYVPFRLFASLIWLDRVTINGQGAWRVFRQPVTHDGYPIGVCQTYPVDRATEAKWIGA